MYTHDPVSLLALHHVQHRALVAEATTASARRADSLRARMSNAYYAAVRRAYLHARAARVTASRVTL